MSTRLTLSETNHLNATLILFRAVAEEHPEILTERRWELADFGLTQFIADHGHRS